MNKGIHHAVRHLARRQGVGVNRIQHRKDRLHVLVHKGLLVAGGFAGNHRTFVGLGAGGGQGQHRTHRDGTFDVAAASLQDVPRVDTFIVVRRCGDKFGAVEH
ncbi:Uncharacterised protein [Leclercia adecarboxylata]|uniref:Uncharacterized protein n=1 Tax=Leclercia adecarboxylata TaxID=83655 RepID=A0A4U9IQ41_9ENTR|nr:Uncharacterised protein [Leclercia adecarboxylata]